MSWIKPLLASVVVTAGSFGFVYPAMAQEAPGVDQPAEKPKKADKADKADKPEKAKADKPEKAEKPAAIKGPKLTVPWSKLTTLTPEQKIKIDELHQKGLADRKAAETAEESSIMAVLTDQQKVELQALKEEEAAKRKTKVKDKVEKPAKEMPAAPAAPAADGQ